MAFGIPLSQVIANDRAFKRRQDALKESRRDGLDLEASILCFRAEKRQFFSGNKPPVGSSADGLGSPPATSAAPAPGLDSQNKPMSPTFLDNTGRQRRVRQLRAANYRSYLLSPFQAVKQLEYRCTFKDQLWGLWSLNNESQLSAGFTAPEAQKQVGGGGSYPSKCQSD